MGDGRAGLFDDFLDEGVVAVGEGVAALIAVESGREGADINAFAYPSFMPIGIPGEHFYIIGAEVVLGLSSILHDGGFKHAWG